MTLTRASRDRGVDAIMFDPDPVRGGKYVLQAKRYTRTVDVAAVRDLYGTVVNEGANRGILVTTASYGPDRTFSRPRIVRIKFLDDIGVVALLLGAFWVPRIKNPSFAIVAILLQRAKHLKKILVFLEVTIALAKRAAQIAGPPRISALPDRRCRLP